MSLPKLILWLKRKERFAHAIEEGTLETLWRDLRRDMAALLCKQKRKRQNQSAIARRRRAFQRELYTGGDNDGGASGLA